jgi:hypothetical protein
MDAITPEVLNLFGAPLRARVPKFGIYYEGQLVKLCRDAKISLKKDVHPDVLSGKRRVRVPATKP